MAWRRRTGYWRLSLASCLLVVSLMCFFANRIDPMRSRNGFVLGVDGMPRLLGQVVCRQDGRNWSSFGFGDKIPLRNSDSWNIERYGHECWRQLPPNSPPTHAQCSLKDYIPRDQPLTKGSCLNALSNKGKRTDISQTRSRTTGEEK